MSVRPFEAACACGGGCPRCAGARADQGEGRPLDSDLRATFGPRLGADLGGVRVHAGPAAARAAARLGARAFALGEELFFGAGEYAPRSAAGRWLIAHELAHVAQRGAGPGDPRGAVEAEARAVAGATAGGRTARPLRRHDGSQPLLFGEPEAIPDVTFIAAEEGDGFLEEAMEYHASWGLAPIRVGSLQAVVHHLAGGAGRLGRVRIVAHAEDFGLLLGVAEGEPRETLLEERVSAWAEGPAAGLRFDVGAPFGALAEETQARILAAIREEHAGVLAPFGLERAGLPRGALAELIQRATDRQLLAASRTPDNADRIDAMIAGVDAILDQARAAVAIEGPLEAEAIARIEGFARRAVRGGAAYSPTAERATRVGAVVSALQGGLGADLAAARARFDASSWIDLRGCNVGEREGYLRAIARFFGAAPDLPHVSAPRWYQVFPILASRPLADDAAIVGAVSDASVAASLRRWAALTGVADEVDALRGLYQAELDRRRASEGAAAAGTAPAAAAAAEGPGVSEGAASAAAVEVSEGAASEVTAAAPVLRPTSAADRVLVDHLGDPSTRLSAAGIAAPRFSLAVDRRAADPLGALVERALAGLEGPNALALYYFHAPHLLPAYQPREGSYSQVVFYLHPARGPALANWLASQWVGAPAGAAALAEASITAAAPRRVQGLISGDEPDDADLVFPPDPAYWAQIRRI